MAAPAVVPWPWVARERQQPPAATAEATNFAGDPAAVAGHHDPPDGSVNPTGSCRPGAEPGWP